MPRPQRHNADSLAAAALPRFWAHGYSATSVDDLVKATGASRHAIYGAHGGKRALYLASFAVYRAQVVDPAFAAVETPRAGLDAIAGYFEAQIARAEAGGLPGPGCLIANAATETAPHDANVAGLVAAHATRLRAGFASALATALGGDRSAEGAALYVFATGLWALSRTVADAAPLRHAVRAQLALFDRRTAP